MSDAPQTLETAEVQAVDLVEVARQATRDRRCGERYGYTNDWMVEERQGRRYGYLVALPTLSRDNASSAP